MSNLSFLKIYSYIKESRKLWLVAVFFNSLQNLIVNICFGYTLKMLMDLLLSSNVSLNVFLLLLVGALYLVLALPYLSYILDKSIASIEGTLRHKIITRIISIPFKDSDDKHSSHYNAILQNDVANSLGLFNWNFVGLLQAVLSGLFSLFIILMYKWEIGVVSVALGLLLYASCNLFVKPLSSIGAAIRKIMQERLGVTTDFFENFSMLRIYNMTSKVSSKIAHLSYDKKQQENKYNSRINGINSLKILITDIGFFSCILIMGVYYIVDGSLTLGTLLLILQLGSGVVFLFGSVGQYITSYQHSIISASNIVELLSGEEEKTNVPLANVSSFELAIKDVSFRYSNSNEYILKNLNLKIEKGDMCRIIGANGSGKSTLLKLIMGVYEVDKGEILINGINVKDLSSSDIAGTVGISTQNYGLVNDTIVANILLGRECNEEKYKNICRICCVDEIINEKGNDYVINEDSSNVSRGEMQRIILARALLSSPKLLLLDELNANLDHHTFTRIIRNITAEFKDLSLISIEHIASSINFNKVLNL